MQHTNSLRVETLSRPGQRRDAALTFIFSSDAGPGGPGFADGPARCRLRVFLDHASRQGLSIDLLTAAWDGEQIVAAWMAIESPGRSAILYQRLSLSGSAYREVAVASLRALQEEAWEQGLLLLQVLVGPEDNALADVLHQAGFAFLTDLLYQNLRVEEAADMAPDAVGRPIRADLRFQTYQRGNHDLFVETLERTYVESLDCPNLKGIRSAKDVLAGHRATGQFHPDAWFVALDGQRAAGMILLAGVANRSALEVVYVGVVPEARGEGVGDALIARAVAEGRRREAAELTLAVDCTNQPARQLYDRWGFVTASRRAAWIAAPHLRHRR